MVAEVDFIFRKIQDELRFATAKFPEWPTDPIHAIAVVNEEVGELNKAVLEMCYEPHKTSTRDIEKEAFQVAAMAIRFIASLAEYRYERGEQHEQVVVDA